LSFDFDALDHENFMREALKEAELAGQEGERPIGAVIVHQGQVIGRGRTQHRARHSGIAHAEMNALLQAEQYIHAHIHDGCVIYTTVEPCVMCLGAIVMSDIDHIVYALVDNWIKPSTMLENEHIRRHIRHYVGGILVNESVKLWEHFNPPAAEPTR
jgi:tRNA(adenine34) deaminase